MNDLHLIGHTKEFPLDRLKMLSQGLLGEESGKHIHTAPVFFGLS